MPATTPSKRTKLAPSDWETKICPCCSNTPLMPSLLDTGALRKWSGTKVQGTFCYWCRRYQATRHAIHNAATFKAELSADPAMAFESKLGAYAYITLRLDGRIHISIEMLEQRVKVIKMGAGIIDEAASGGFVQCILLEDLRRLHPEINPIAKQMPILQFFVGGRRRLGVRAPCPRRSDTLWQSALPNGVCMSSDVRTDLEADWALLISMSQEAAKLQLAMSQISATAVKQQVCDDPGEEADVGPEDEEALAAGVVAGVPASSVAFPKGRLGNSMGKLQNRIHGYLMELKTEGWRKQLRDATARAQITGAVGLQHELEQAEYPGLMPLCNDFIETLNAIRSLILADAKHQKDESYVNLIPFAVPLGILAAKLAKIQTTATLDVELLILQALD
jgi:hypothetical protein